MAGDDVTQAYPLQWPEGWPRSRGTTSAKFGKVEREYTQHSSYARKKDITMQDAMKRVRSELERLGVNVEDDMVVSTNLRLNLSGLPRGDQGEPTDRGVAVYWQKKGKPMVVLAVDRYDRVRDNLAAIAATLDAMRAIERHGGAQILERAFTGFAALPAPGAAGDWRMVLGPSIETLSEAEARYRELAKLRHPDAPGGGHEKMAELNKAIADARQDLF